MDLDVKECLLFMISDDISDSESSDYSSSDSELEKVVTSVVSEIDEVITLENRQIRKNYAEKRIAQYTDQQFVRNLGVEKNLALALAQKFEQSPHYQSFIEEEKIYLSSKNHIYIFLWFVCHQNMTYRAVSRFFNVSLTTIHVTLQRVGLFLNDLAPHVLRWPNSEEKLESVNGYLKLTAITGIIGCVGNTFIRTDQAAARSRQHLVPIQGVCKHDNKFIDVFIGSNRLVNDESLFEQSGLENKINLLTHNQHIVGGSEFPSSQHLIIPMMDDFICDETQLDYNNKLAICLEQNNQCFDHLKDKFRQLNCMKVRNSKLQYLIIQACFVLYNLSIDMDEIIRIDHDYSNYNLLDIILNQDDSLSN